MSPWPSKPWLSPILKDQAKETVCLKKDLEVGTSRSLGVWAVKAVITLRAYCVPGSVLSNFYLHNTCVKVGRYWYCSFTDEEHEVQRGNDLCKVI